MPRETVLQGFATPPPNAMIRSVVSAAPPSEGSNWNYFRVRNGSATSNVFITSIVVSRIDGFAPIPIRIETVQGNPVDTGVSPRWLDLNRAGVPNVSGGQATQGTYPFTGLVTNNDEKARLLVGREPMHIPFPLVLPPAYNVLFHTMSRGGFQITVYFFSPE